MGAKSKREETEDRVLAYKLRMKKKASEPPLEVTEKGRYLTLLYDIKNGRKLLPEEQKRFDLLEKKYGKK